jgi:hypothetical protein
MLCVLHVLGGGWCWKKKNFRWINLEWFSGLNMHYNFMRHCSCRLLVCLVYRLYSSAKHALYFLQVISVHKCGYHSMLLTFRVYNAYLSLISTLKFPFKKFTLKLITVILLAFYDWTIS